MRSTTFAVNNVITYAHVLDVDASLAFYALLGFAPKTTLKEPSGRAYWSRVHSGKGELMLARASGPIDAEQQAVLFYMYSDDVAALRQHLVAGGLRDTGAYRGHKTPTDGPSSVFEISHPPHMPAGELRITDPDGYIILVGQLG
jgi:hypothetical protein